jgi:hypothetical protein
MGLLTASGRDHYVTVYIRPDLHKPIAKHQRQSQIDDNKVDQCP